MQTATLRTATSSFLDLTAADLMTTPVTTIPHAMSLREAAHLLTHERISGAPVVDAEGQCIGVLSSSHFVTWAGEDGSGKSIHFIAPWGEMIDIDDFPSNEIRHYMTAQPVTVAPTTSVGELAQKMVDAHIHRVLVVVDQNRPQGVEQTYGPQHAEEEEAGPETPEEERVGPPDRQRLERLFEQAIQDRSKAFELKQELDRLGVFKEHEDRFLDLFKKPGG